MIQGELMTFDLATKFGWARGPLGSMPISGSQMFAAKGATTKEVVAGSIRYFHTTFRNFTPKLVVFESPLDTNQTRGKTTKDTVRRLMALAANCEAIAHMNGIYSIREATVSDVRTWFLGNNPRGVVGKQRTMDVLRHMGLDPVDDNAGDALALWFYTAAQISQEEAIRINRLMPARFNKR